MIAGFDAKLVSSADTPLTIGNVPSGMEALLFADMARASTSVAYVMSDGQRVADLEQILGFVAPDIPVMTLPAWDCLPYDRVSPSADTSARRLAAPAAGACAHAATDVCKTLTSARLAMYGARASMDNDM